MLKSLFDSLMWESRFDDKYKFQREYVFSNLRSKRLEEKILYWKVWGKKLRKTPDEALEQALFEYCEEFRLANAADKYATSKLLDMAKTMARQKTPKHNGTTLVMPEQQLTPEWQLYLK